MCQKLEVVLGNEAQVDPMEDSTSDYIPMIVVHKNIPIKIKLGKILNINANLTDSQWERLLKFLQKHKHAFTWDYTNMNGIDHELCTHHIYIEKYVHPLHQP